MNSFNARKAISVSNKPYIIYSLKALGDLSKLPYSLRVLLECLLRTEGQGSVSKQDIEALVNWEPKAEPSKEIAFTPRARAPSRLHRRSLRRRSGRHARSHGKARWRPPRKSTPFNPSRSSSTTRCRLTPLDHPRHWASIATSNSTATRSDTSS